MLSCRNYGLLPSASNTTLLRRAVNAALKGLRLQVSMQYAVAPSRNLANDFLPHTQIVKVDTVGIPAQGENPFACSDGGKTAPRQNLNNQAVNFKRGLSRTNVRWAGGGV